VIKISVPTANPAELQRGLEAAAAVFKERNVDPRDGADGLFALEGYDLSGFDPTDAPSDAEWAAIEAWQRAGEAALEAVCRDWSADRKRPDSARLQVIIHEAQTVDRATALTRLRALAGAEAGRREFGEPTHAMLADVVADDLEDRDVAFELVAAVTIAYTTLSLSQFHPDEPIEPKRQALRDAIDQLEVGTAALLS